MSKINRHIIYVDASFQDTMSVISLYEKNGANIVVEIDNQDFHIKNSVDAEALAVFNAILFVKSKNYKRTVILSDNESVAKKYADYEQDIKISWIVPNSIEKYRKGLAVTI